MTFRMRLRFGTLLIAVQALPAQAAELPPDVLLLARAKAHIRQSIAALPNYTCVETIDRQQDKAVGSSLRRVDLIRLEVAKSGRRELFAWPGSREFEDKPISAFVAGGLIGDGTYSLFAEDLFVNGVASMKVHGPEQLKGHPAVRVDYVTRLTNASTFTIANASGSADVGYSGSYWFDPQNLNLLRLDIEATDIPLHLQLSTVRMSVEYNTVKMRERDITLAGTSTIEFVYASGVTSRDYIYFTNCREFAGQTSIIFDGEAAVRQDELSPIRGKTFILPGDLTIPLRLQSAIDAGTARIGDQITALVERDVREGLHVWLPKESVAHGRIRRLERRAEGTKDDVLAGLEFSDVDVGRDKAEFVGRLQSLQLVNGVELYRPERRESRRVDQPNGVGGGGAITVKVQEWFERDIPGTGYVVMTGAPWRIPEGVRMTWKTEAVRAKDGR